MQVRFSLAASDELDMTGYVFGELILQPNARNIYHGKATAGFIHARNS
jgi:hypothetical protein